MADCHSQHTGCRYKQNGGSAQHPGILAAYSSRHNGCQPQTAHHNGVIQPQVVIMDILGQLFLGLFAGLGLIGGLDRFGLFGRRCFLLAFYRFLLRLGGGQGFLLDLLGGFALLCGAARLFQHFGGQLGDDNGLGMFLQGRLFVAVLTVLCVGQGAFPP